MGERVTDEAGVRPGCRPKPNRLDFDVKLL